MHLNSLLKYILNSKVWNSERSNLKHIATIHLCLQPSQAASIKTDAVSFATASLFDAVKPFVYMAPIETDIETV